MMLCGIALAFVPLTQREEAAAKADLGEMMDAAFSRIDSGKTAAAPVVVAEKESLLEKTRAVVRFLAHDDNLLETDALSTLCDQLGADCIDVADVDGVLIASSDETRIGLDLGAQDGFIWTMDAIETPESEIVQTNEDDESMICCCVSRSDTEGFVLLTRDDPYVDDAVAKSDPEALIEGIAYGGDLLFVAESGGADGYFYDAGSLCLRRTQDDVTLIAARDVSDVFAARNAALFALVVGIICVIICGVAAYLLRLEPVVLLDEDGNRIESGEERASLNPGKTEADAQTPPEPPKKRRKKPHPEKADESTEPEADGEAPRPEDEQQTEKRPAKRLRKKRKTDDAKSEDPFDKIVD